MVAAIRNVPCVAHSLRIEDSKFLTEKNAKKFQNLTRST
jgi:hypothetical protein